MATSRLDLSAQLGAPCPDYYPLKVEGALLRWLQQHFAESTNITFPDLQSRTWIPGETTNILIESIGRWRPPLTEKRPALILKRHKAQILRLGLGADRLMGGGGPEAAKRKHSILVVGAHTVFAIGGDSGECELLAAETYRELMKFAPIVREKLDLVRVRVHENDGMHKLEEAREGFVAPINLEYAFWDSWELNKQDAALLRKISVSFGS